MLALLALLAPAALATPAPMYGEWALDYRSASTQGPLLPAAELTRHANLRFLVGHLFGTGEQAGTNVSLGFSFGLWNRLDLAMVHHTAATEQLVELRGQILDQEGVRVPGRDGRGPTGEALRGPGAPLSLTAVAGADIVMNDELADRSGYYAQLVAARSLAGPWLTVGLVPTAVIVPADEEGALHLSAGAHLGLRPANDWGVAAELATGVPGLNGPGLRWGVGMSGYTAGHVLTLQVANSLAQTPGAVGVFDPEGLDGALCLGFSIARDFGPN